MTASSQQMLLILCDKNGLQGAPIAAFYSLYLSGCFPPCEPNKFLYGFTFQILRVQVLPFQDSHAQRSITKRGRFRPLFLAAANGLPIKKARVRSISPTRALRIPVDCCRLCLILESCAFILPNLAGLSMGQKWASWVLLDVRDKASDCVGCSCQHGNRRTHDGACSWVSSSPG